VSEGASPDAPVFRAVGEAGLLVELGDRIDDLLNRRVLALDAALAANPPPGFREAVPAYASLFIAFDPLETDHDGVEQHVRALRPGAVARFDDGAERTIGVSYAAAVAPDLAAAATALGLDRQELVERHLAGRYRVYMCGFAPGYAYLGMLDERLRLPRKPAIVRDVPAGSVIIAGAQCIVTTLSMPTGWWVIGRSDARLFDPSAASPFLLAPGDRVRFEAVDPAGPGGA
jgi:inhibitor of KinA